MTDKNKWKVQPDTTVQVVDPMGLNVKAEPDEPRHNWYGLCISLGIIFSVGTLVAIAAFVILPLNTPPFHGRRINLQDLSDPNLKSAPLCSQWLSGSKVAYFSEGAGLLSWNLYENVTTKLISNLTLSHIGASEFSISSDGQYVLLTHDVIQGRLFKKTAKYTIYDLRKHYYYPLKLNIEHLEQPRYQSAQWLKPWTQPYESNYSISSSELIVIENNNLVFLKAPNSLPRQLTTDGKENEIYYGVPDAMYEEILRSSSSFWPNSYGNLLAYLSFNDTMVNETPILKYKDIPKNIFLRYATVQSSIPEVFVWIMDVQNDSKWRLSPPSPIKSKEHYVLGVGWIDESKLWVSWVSRDQSTFLLSHCYGTDWECSTVHVNHQVGSISPTVDSVMWSERWAAFPWPRQVQEALWHNHVTMVGLKGAHHPALKLNGCHVAKVLSSFFNDEKIFFLGSEISEGTQKQHLYSLTLNDESLNCLSCSIGCPRVTASLNPNLTHAVVTCVGTHIPSMHLMSLDPGSNISIPLHSQPLLKAHIKKLALPISIYKDVVLSTSVHASVDISLPPGWIKGDESFLYPLIVHIVGVEDYDERDKELNRLGLAEILASGNYIAHAKIQLLRSSQYVSTQTIASNLNKVIRVILSEHDFLDKTQVSLWGWGSGASLALQLSRMGDPSFKCVLAINPVTDWRQYGSYWAERFLGSLTSVGAVQRYEESNLLRSVTSFAPSLMIMTSASDPISHHSAYLTKALIQNEVNFQQMVYPESTLALRMERRHVLSCMLNFFLRDECAKVYYEYFSPSL